jgi:sulfatase modifying factor 1
VSITRSALMSLLVASIACIAAPARAQCVADLVADGRVDGADLGVLLAYWGPTTSSNFSLASDFNHDGSVDGIDLGVLMGGWGACAPVVTSISPNTGVPSGGTPVTISGRYFVGVTAVKFGGTPAASFTITSTTQITVITPPGALGTVNVEVSTQTSASTVVGGFTYADIAVPPWATLIELLPDPAVVTDPVLRQRIAVSGWAWRVRETATQIEMLLVPSGSFQMGCSPSEQHGCNIDEYPIHSVALTTAFYLGRYEVTQSQWSARMGSNPSAFQGSRHPDAPDRPVEMVSWTAVHSFLIPAGLRLPTEAEWEYACRSGTATAFNNGSSDDELVSALAWHKHNSSGRTHRVGEKVANSLGFHDMHGNVWEWVGDRYSASYYSESPAEDPLGPAIGSGRVARGGSWIYDTGACRSSLRAQAPEGAFDFTLGFRVARNP